MAHNTLESALDRVIAAADGALVSTAALVKGVKQTRSAAVTGKLADLEKAIAQAKQQLGVVAERLALLEASWDFDPRAHFESEGYSQELLEAIKREDMRPVERDGRILCFPSILRVLPGEQALEIDRKKERRLRPSLVAAELKKHRGRKTGMRPEQLIEILFNTWEPLVAKQKGTTVVRAVDIYELLTQLPSAREYSRQEFARDLVQLDMSEVRSTKAGRRLELRADTASRGSAVLSAVTPDGEVRLYSGVEFI